MNRRTIALLVGGFLVVDAFLVLGVLRHVSQDPPASDLASPDGSASPAAGETPGPAGQQEPYDFDPEKAYALTFANDGTIMYALRGSCDGDPGKMVVSKDGGGSITSPSTGLAAIYAVAATSRSDLRVVGADGDCRVLRLRSDDGGDTWSPDADDRVWYPDPDDARKIVSPDGTTDAGCTVTSISQVGATFGRVSCSDGTIRGTGNGGKEWVDLGRLDNVRVAAFSTFNTGYALAVYQGCAAQQMATRDGGRTWSVGGCITGEPAQGIAVNDTALVGVVDNQFYVSDDGGTSWRQP